MQFPEIFLDTEKIRPIYSMVSRSSAAPGHTSWSLYHVFIINVILVNRR